MSLKRQRTHQPTPFQLKKEIRRGEISEKGKGGGWWGASAYGGQAARLRLAFACEMGSDFSVKSHQTRIFSGIAAHWGGFFSGGAQRLPAVRRGELGNGAGREPRFFVTAASGGFLLQ